MMENVNFKIALLYYIYFSTLNINVDCVVITPQDADQFRDASEVIRSRGFIAEEHQVITRDGYILTLQRIVNPSLNRNYLTKPLLLVHGVLASATDWLLNSPGYLDESGNFIEDHYYSPTAYRKLNGKRVPIGGSLGFVLSQFGYDVWLGNCRGNTYSKNHTYLNYKDAAYWKFSLDQIALLDLPAMIQHILKVTKRDSIGYIAHSQGTLIMFALLSAKPYYSNIINPFIALAPVVFLSNTSGILPIRELSFLHPVFREIPLGLLPPIRPQLLLQGKLCSSKALRYVCGILLGLASGYNPNQMNFERIGTFASHFPTSVSTNVLSHYAQIAKTGRFAMFDYGPHLNRIKYGRSIPPEYPLHLIDTSRVALFYGLNDVIGDISDVQTLKKHLREPLFGDVIINDYLWSHNDFFLAKNVGYLVNAKVLDLLGISNDDSNFAIDFDEYLRSQQKLNFETNDIESNINIIDDQLLALNKLLR